MKPRQKQGPTRPFSQSQKHINNGTAFAEPPWKCGNQQLCIPFFINPTQFFSFFFLGLGELPERDHETCFSCKPPSHHLIPYVSLQCTSFSSLKHASASPSVIHSSTIFVFPTFKIQLMLSLMGDRQQPHQVLVHPQRYEGGFKGQQTGGGPSATKILAVVTLLPVGGGLLALAGITFVGSFIALCLATPVFLLFSPVIVPAALVIGLAVAAFLASGAFGLTGVSSLSWVARCFQRATGAESLDQAKRRMQDMAGYVGLKTKEMGQEIQRKAHEGK